MERILSLIREARTLPDESPVKLDLEREIFLSLIQLQRTRAAALPEFSLRAALGRAGYSSQDVEKYLASTPVSLDEETVDLGILGDPTVGSEAERQFRPTQRIAL